MGANDGVGAREIRIGREDLEVEVVEVQCYCDDYPILFYNFNALVFALSKQGCGSWARGRESYGNRKAKAPTTIAFDFIDI